jgi:hypothetical protein
VQQQQQQKEHLARAPHCKLAARTRPWLQLQAARGQQEQQQQQKEKQKQQGACQTTYMMQWLAALCSWGHSASCSSRLLPRQQQQQQWVVQAVWSLLQLAGQGVLPGCSSTHPWVLLWRGVTPRVYRAVRGCRVVSHMEAGKG